MRYVQFAGDVGLGDYPSDYAAWVNSVKALGGSVTARSGVTVAKWTDPAVWVPLVNAKKIDARTASYANSGKTIYIPAPAAIQEAAQHLTDLTTRENVKVLEEGAKDAANAVLGAPRNALAGLLGVPAWVIPLAIGVGVVALTRTLLPVAASVASSYARRNPPRQRRRRRRSRRARR